MKNYKFIMLICFVCAGFSLSAQTELSGEIVDKNSNALANVSVSFNNGMVKTISDNAGKFTLTYPDTVKTRNLRFQLFGYKTKAMIINKNQQNMKIILLDSTYNLDGAKVLASRNGRFSDYSAQTLQMSTFDIVTNPAAMADIIGNMRVLPGVQSNDTDGRLIIQGGDTDESQIYINDLIVANPYSLSSKNSGSRSRFTPDLFDGTVLQSGGFNAEFGQAMSGIINLNTKEHEQMLSKTDIAISSAYADITHIGKKPSYAYRASLNYINMMPYTKIIPDDTYDWEKHYQQISADVYFTKQFSQDTKITAQFNSSYADGVYNYKDVDNVNLKNNIRQTYVYTQINFYHSFNSKLSLSAAGNVVIDGLSGTETQYQNDKINTKNIWNHNKITLQYKTRKITNRTGAEFIYSAYDETYTFITDYKTNVQNNLASIYNDTKIFFGNNITASIGLRGEYSFYLKKFNAAPRLYFAYRLDAENIFSFSAGDYFQLPSINYLKTTNSIDFVSAAKATTSYSYVKRKTKFQIDAYYKKYKNVVTYQQGQFINNDGKGYGWGADIFWKSDFKSLEYWLSYSYNNTKKHYDYFLQSVVPSYVAQHSFNATLKYFIAPLKSLVATSYYISSGAPYYSDVSPYEKLGKTPFRSRLDASWSFLPKQWIVVHFGCQNILGRKNIYGYEYSKITQGLRREITASNTRFYFVGVFVTLSYSKTLNQLKALN
ncbi:MAG: TonB-dependent receptor [Prevotellaceae bacterium]|jgi:hypothetical protein|nr:TonB-dependent receptor [Prevotellaceae bacterium]